MYLGNVGKISNLRNVKPTEGNMQEQEMITTTQAGNMLGVSGQTVRMWIASGKIDAIRTLGGKIRVKSSSVAKLLESLEQNAEQQQTQ